jgi:formamidopyrimidine-DNA glycosylase
MKGFIFSPDRFRKLISTMPELPEVETVRRGLNRVTLNRPIQGGELRLRSTLEYPKRPKQLWDHLTGCRLRDWERRGKYLLGHLLDHEGHPAGVLGVHLRMTGKMLWVKQDEAVSVHCRMRFLFDQGDELRFVDQRTFGRIWWVPPDQAPGTIIGGLASLGPEPFSDDFTVEYLRRQLQKSKRPIKNALLDQRLVAGVGNIYADEALFLSGIRPTTPSGRIRNDRLARLHRAVIDVLNTSIENGGTTFSDYRDVYGVNGNYGGVAWVYDREHEQCRRCETPIRRMKLAGRSAHYCPRCQR